MDMKGWVEHRDEEAKKQRWFNLELGIVLSLSPADVGYTVEVEKITGGVCKFPDMAKAVKFISDLVGE
jgi:hypothetical protein